MAKNYYGGLHDAFHAANGSMQLTPQGSGGFDMHPDTLAPSKPKLMGAKPQSQAQHESVLKAGRTSAAKRHAASGKALLGAGTKGF
ncbi:hypothetical protein [Caudoviricetes sp.]|nr:hypothetical protein [Caudoviricetes sp.]